MGHTRRMVRVTDNGRGSKPLRHLLMRHTNSLSLDEAHSVEEVGQ